MTINLFSAIARRLGILKFLSDNHYELERLARMCESPMEEVFLRAAYPILREYSPIEPQYRIGPYFVDFALPAVNVIVEIDGHAFHSTKEQLARDMHRQRVLCREGWMVLRFTGSEIYANPHLCAREVEDIINANS